MGQVDIQALNKKLAEWAGFTWNGLIGKGRFKVEAWNDPNGNLTYALPNFANSLDACFEWLVPKLWELGVIGIDFGKDYCYLEFGYGKLGMLETGESALALCLAIEKLIDEKDSTSS